MQKRIFTFLFLIAIVLSYSTFAEAALQFLPRYQGGYGSRTQQGGRDKVCDPVYRYSCSGTGYAGGVGTSCNNLFQSCSCSTNYKWSGGSCVLKSCSDYGYSASKDNTKSCEEKTPRSGLTCYVCTACDSSTYKYACSGGLNASTQGTTNKCGTNYSECSCVEHASWNSTSGKCECGSDYKAGTTSCTLKTCEDYGYSATEDTTKDCTKQTPRSGLTCWNCSDCTGTLYDCSSITNASGADTSSTSCGGKYAKCKCKDLYVWDNGVCKLGCTRNSCSTTTYPLTAQNAANASSYEKCTPSCSDEAPRYKVSACASGYNVNSNGSGCEAVPTKTCEEVLTEKGYILIKSDYDFFNRTFWNKAEIYQPMVIMNDIRAGIGFDSSGQESGTGSNDIYADLLTPEYFHAEYPQCSGIPTITNSSDYLYFYPTNQDKELRIYPNFNFSSGADLYVDYDRDEVNGKVIFYGNIEASDNEGTFLNLYEPMTAEFRGEKVNAAGIYGWDVVLGTGTRLNAAQANGYQVGTLTLENGASLSTKIWKTNNDKYFWYTITSSGETTYNSTEENNWPEILPNGCSSSGIMTADSWGAKAVCTGKLSYMCEATTAADREKRDGSESETHLSYCQGQTLDCGTESCSTVANRNGKLITEASQLSSNGNITSIIYLGKSISVSGNLKLDNAHIYNASESFKECMCDSSIENNPTLTVNGTVELVSGSSPISVNVNTNFSTLKNGGFGFYKDATIGTWNVSVGYWSGDPAMVTLRLYDEITVNINEAKFTQGEHAMSMDAINFEYYADNAHVNIKEAICMWKEMGNGVAPCTVTANYMNSAGNGTFKYCPIQYGSVSSSEMAQNIWINGFDADEINGKKGDGYPSSYPAATVTCSY